VNEKKNVGDLGGGREGQREKRLREGRREDRRGNGNREVGFYSMRRLYSLKRRARSVGSRVREKGERVDVH